MGLRWDFELELGNFNSCELRFDTRSVEVRLVSNGLRKYDSMVFKLSSKLDLSVFLTTVLTGEGTQDNFLEHRDFCVHKASDTIFIAFHAKTDDLIRGNSFINFFKKLFKRYSYHF